jgi:hypothetical protein
MKDRWAFGILLGGLVLPAEAIVGFFFLLFFSVSVFIGVNMHIVWALSGSATQIFGGLQGVHNVLYVLVVGMLIAVLPWQAGLWISGREKGRGVGAEVFRLCGPLAIVLFLFFLYARVDHILSLRG